MVIRRSRSLQCLMSKIFETTYHHKFLFNSKDLCIENLARDRKNCDRIYLALV
jgi:hypothetical protein